MNSDYEVFQCTLCGRCLIDRPENVNFGAPAGMRRGHYRPFTIGTMDSYCDGPFKHADPEVDAVYRLGGRAAAEVVTLRKRKHRE